jgi:hypothetical protein
LPWCPFRGRIWAIKAREEPKGARDNCGGMPAET